MNLTHIGKTILWVYTKHILAFTAGVIAGSIQTLFICAALWLRS